MVPVVIAVVGVIVFFAVTAGGAILLRRLVVRRPVMAVIPRLVPAVIPIARIITGGLQRWPPVLEHDNAYADKVPEPTHLVTEAGEVGLWDENDLLSRNKARVHAPRRDEELPVVVGGDVIRPRLSSCLGLRTCPWCVHL
jgi:hypothetical protein